MYVEQEDIKTGFTLFNKAMEVGCPRCKFETGSMMSHAHPGDNMDLTLKARGFSTWKSLFADSGGILTI
jgi:hypothetical protein